MPQQNLRHEPLTKSDVVSGTSGDELGLPLPVSTLALLDAMNGCAYITSLDGKILVTAQNSMENFLVENGGDVTGSGLNLVGRSLFGCFLGDDVQSVYQKLHGWILERQSDCVHFDFRCDAPEVERNMRMSISPIFEEGEMIAVLYQSMIIGEIIRPPMDIFMFQKLVSQNPEDSGTPILTICSFCHDVVYPMGQKEPDRRWIPPEQYYREGGSNEVLLSHSVCPKCLSRVTGEEE